MYIYILYIYICHADSAPWFDMCTVWFVASLKAVEKVMKYIGYVMPTCAISGLYSGAYGPLLGW